MKPSGLANCCSRCGERKPYDPQAQSDLCGSCLRTLAFGGSFAMPAGSSSGLTQQDDEVYITTPQITATTPNEQSVDYASVPQPTTVPTSDGTSYSASPPATMESHFSFKRKYDDPEDDYQQYPRKQHMHAIYALTMPSSLRQNASPPTFDAKQNMANALETDDEGGEGDEFVDAPEDQNGDANPTGPPDVESQADAEGEIERPDYDTQLEPGTDADEGAVSKEDEEEEEELHEEEEPPADEDDLFTQNFGPGSNNNANKQGQNDDDSDSDIEEIPPADEIITSSAGGAGNPADFDRTVLLASLTGNNNKSSTTNPSPTTPAVAAVKRKPFQPTHRLGFQPPYFKHLSHNFTKQRLFHLAALHYIPRLPLAAHRYWIGVLKLGASPHASKLTERSFTWLKGNRVTTVETVRNAVSNGMATDEDRIVLLLGFERPRDGVRCEELDYHNDRRIFFRAVAPGHPDAKGRPLAEGLIREVDLEEKEVEVIELD